MAIVFAAAATRIKRSKRYLCWIEPELREMMLNQATAGQLLAIWVQSHLKSKFKSHMLFPCPETRTALVGRSQHSLSLFFASLDLAFDQMLSCRC